MSAKPGLPGEQATQLPVSAPELAENLRQLLEKVCEFSRPCKACCVQLWFVRLKSGKLAPYTHEGVNHFADCTGAAQFKRGGKS